MARLGKKRLSVDIPEDLHEDIKKLAELHNVTITKIIIDLLIQLALSQKQYE